MVHTILSFKYFSNFTGIFFKTLCQRLTILLRDQCESIDTNTDWLLQTANCGEDIQSSGTFRKAVNLRINNTITPLIAELIACLDRNGNLELALYNEEEPECLFNLWHDIFRDERLLVLQYKDTISPNTLQPRRRVPVLSDGAGGQYFECSFPFSFFIKDFVLDLWKQFIIRKPDTSISLWGQFESIFNQTTLGQLVNLNLMSDEKGYDSILHYLMDFIHMHTHASTQDQYNVYESVILLRIELFSDHQASEEEEQSEITPNRTLTIPKIHCAYEESKQLLDLLQQAFILEKDLERKLFRIIKEMNENKDSRLSCLELILLEEIIASCHHTRERTACKEQAEKYVTEIRQWQSVVERGLSFNRPDYPGYNTTVNSIRAKWNRILAVQLFVSNCTLAVQHSCTESSTNRLFMILTETPDFTSVQTIKDTLDILSDCLSRLPGGQRGLMKLKQKFRECATRFFISLLTSLTFKSLPSSQPNAELIELLMEFVILDKGNMEELERNEKSSINLFKKNGLNPSLSFKTFLLQLMIKHRRDVFEDILSHYLSHSLLDLENIQAKQELYMIIIHSIEDSRHQFFKQQSIEEQIFLIDFTLRNDSPRIYGLANHSYIQYATLEMIATLRYICIHISHWIIECFKLKTLLDSQLPGYIVAERRRLIFNFKNICLMHGNENLHVFLLKNIYHQLGSDTLHLITNNRDCSWIIPENVIERMMESQYQSPDYFMIYGDNYAKLKYSAEQANVSQSKDSLLQYFDAGENNAQEIQTNIEYFLYSIFQIKTESLRRRNNTDESEGFIALRDLFNTNLSTIQVELLQIGIQMLSDTRIGSLHFSSNSNNNQISLSRVIYHMAIMLSSNVYPKLFSPISLLYENPHLLTNTLFPTMMDDHLLTVKQAMLGKEGTGQWYTCVNGHAYFVGECGQPRQAQTCPDCGLWVGQDHRVRQAGTKLNTTADSTKHGYVLGRVDQRQKIPSSERSLSPASVSLIRALMDISFIWSSCSKHPTDSSHVLRSLVRGGLDDPRDLTNFFYLHLERDVLDITQLTGKNFEETTFLLHLIIRSLMDRAGEPCLIHTELSTRELREQWEKEFDMKFIQPILTSLNTDVQKQMEQVLSEKRIANNPLLRIVYERDQSEPNNPLPHLWRYRTIVSLEHFSQSFSTADLNTKNKCPLVDKFLKEENKLFVTRYLPDIVQLQRRVGDKFLHRLDRREAANTSIKDFLDRMKTENKQESEELAKLVESLATAWSIIGEDVKKNGRLKMEEALEQQEITPATSLAYLLPSSTGDGVLITSLTDYLVLIHNSFVHVYRDRVKGSRSDKIPLRELNMSYVIEYEEHLQPLLLSHAHYSLALGQGSQVTYDFEGVEQQLMEQFIQNKPLILAEHLRFEYIREAYNLGVFEQVRHKVQQTELKENLWRLIREELDSLEAVSDVLLVLDVVIGFLSSAGGDPEQKLSTYLYDVLKYSHASHGAGPLQSRRAEGNVSLKHILSFWRFLSIEKASKLSIIGQIPFSSLRDEFREVVSKEEKEQIQSSCDHFPVDKILVFLHDFILFFVRERDAEESNYGMRESIQEYDPDWKLLELFHHFPEGIKLSQCASAWAVLAQQEHIISNQLNNSV
ncbi:E3 ubiquitin-protein ligase [Oopsacas minuta]|uniref:E3 ubiquitin-protein ligase n=1 Tax=Oopsacas minuta TaxID=111878 RepID=A0AAV7K3F3_9METZ|nr:E3 ubiquitin-protein ligase [Oopsacas minuta]